MNLIFSYGAKEDYKLASEGHVFLGAGEDATGGEVHVFKHRDHSLAANDPEQLELPLDE